MRYLLHNQETSRLKFMPIDWSHSDAWLEFHKNPESRKHWIAEWLTPEEECRKWYERQFQRHDQDKGGMNALFEKNTNTFIGHCGLLVQEVDGVEELEVAYSLLPACWNKGYATEAAMKCRDVAFENNYSQSLISIISKTNTPSQNVASKNGMIVDKETLYRDNTVYIYRITRSSWQDIVFR